MITWRVIVRGDVLGCLSQPSEMTLRRLGRIFGHALQVESVICL